MIKVSSNPDDAFYCPGCGSLIYVNDLDYGFCREKPHINCPYCGVFINEDKTDILLDIHNEAVMHTLNNEPKIDEDPTLFD